MFDLHDALSYVVDNEGSDLHLKVPARPMAGFRGQHEPLERYLEPLAPADTERVLRDMLAGTLRQDGGAEGEYYGMQTFDQALLSHYRPVACRWKTRCASPRARTTSAGEGRTATSMNDLAGSNDGAAPGPGPTVQHVRPAPSVAPANGRLSAPAASRRLLRRASRPSGSPVPPPADAVSGLAL